jgi:hypothetical protein
LTGTLERVRDLDRSGGPASVAERIFLVVADRLPVIGVVRRFGFFGRAGIANSLVVGYEEAAQSTEPRQGTKARFRKRDFHSGKPRSGFCTSGTE